MALSLPSDPRSQKLMGGAAAVIVIVGLYFWFLWKPAQAELVTLKTRVDTLEAHNAKDKLAVANNMEGKLKADAERYNNELIVLRRLVPTQNEFSALIDAISTSARLAGMDISDIGNDGVMVGDHFDAVKYRFAVTGPYHKVAEFLTSVGSLPRIVTPINLTLSPTSRAPIERRPGKNETFVDAKFGVLTYVAKTVVTPPAAAKPGAK